ncbi:LOW QUALITY PROTEIN: hypothetical protein Cgig2_028209 [Carnegiea gigantea]|uniref:Ubiquitin-like protease family profile domain-containing protein n=1 Tax=Carnegiea gigantea TaxID=171969 RepID=A0A9Q1GNG6_9CARY|nr:LOW QUALITY PROTEIN: hypothetical protein Cgig2_028209 [Carnegiea gigantea]
MDEEWGMSLGSEYVPSEMGSSTDSTVSMVDGSCEAVGGSSSGGEDAKEVHADSAEGSEKRKSRKRGREPTMEGRRWRRKATGDGFMFNKEGRGLRGVVPVSVRGRCTLEKICKFNKTLEPYQKEAIEGTILKLILEYCPFSMQWELTAALVKAWVPQRKAFRLTGRLVPFSVYNVALFIGLPVTGKIVEFGEDDLSTTELARMVCLRMTQYVTEKSNNLKSEKGRKRLVFRNYIKVMKKLLDANKELEKLELWLSLYAWRVMSGFIFSRTPYGVAWSVQKYMEDVRRMGEYAWAEAVWFYEHTTRFAQHDNCRFPRLASWDSIDHSRRYDAFQLVIPELCPREEKMLLLTVRAFMNPDGFRDYILDGEGVLLYEERLERAREELRAKKGKHVGTLRILEFWKSRAHELEARLKRYAAPAVQQDTRHQLGGDVGVDIQSGLECLAGAVTDVAEASVHEISPGKGTNEDATCEIAADILGSTGVCRRTVAAGAGGRGVRHAATEGDTATTDDPRMESLHHAPPTTADSATADDEACPPVGDSRHRMTTPEQDGEIAGEIERTSPDADDVDLFTDPTRLPSDRKSEKEMKDGVTGADKPRAMDDPTKGSVNPHWKGQASAPSVEELNKIKLTKEVLAGYISAPLLAREMELVTKGGGHAGVSAEAHAGKLVTGPHPCGDLAQQGAYLRRHMDHLKATPHPDALVAVVADLRECSFLVYDSLLSAAVKTRRELLDSTRIAFVLAFLRSSTYADAGQWEVLTPKCPEQRKYVQLSPMTTTPCTHDLIQPGLVTLLFVSLDSGHDCGVFAMAFIDLLSLKADGFEFDQDCVPYYRDKAGQLISRNIYGVCLPLIQSCDTYKVGHVIHRWLHLNCRAGLDAKVTLYIIHPWLVLMYILGYAVDDVGQMRNCIISCILCIK